MTPDGTFGTTIETADGTYFLGPHGETAKGIHVDHGYGRLYCWSGGVLYVQGMPGNDDWYMLHPNNMWGWYGSEPPIPMPLPPKPILPVPPSARSGVVRASSRVYVDDGGAFRPFGGTLFWALYGWKYERVRLEDNLAWLRAQGLDYVRILGQVGWPTETIDPGWPDYVDLLADFLTVAYEKHGLRTEITCIGGGGQFDPVALAHKVVAAVRGREHTVIHLEVVNEYFSTFPDEAAMRRVGEVLRGLPHLLAPSAPKEPQLVDLKRLMATGPYTLATVHKQRQEGDKDWRFVRQNWDFKDEVWPTSNNEPKGPGSSVSSCSDPLRLAMDRAVGIMCGLGAYVLHNANGIFGREQDHPSGGHRGANVWELPNSEAIYRAVRQVATLLPEGVENWTNTNDHWTLPNPVHPLPAAPGEFWETGRGDHGVNKNYGAVNGAQFVCMPCGVLNHVTLTARDACTVQVYDPLTLQRVLHESLPAGGTLRLEGDANANTAYVVVGER